MRRAPRGRVNAPHAPPSTSSWAGEVAGAVRRQFYLGGLRQKAGSLVIMALRRTRKPQAASQVKKYQFAAFHAALACGLRLARSARGPHASTRQASEHPSSPARQKLSLHSFILETAACADAEPEARRRRMLRRKPPSATRGAKIETQLSDSARRGARTPQRRAVRQRRRRRRRRCQERDRSHVRLEYGKQP